MQIQDKNRQRRTTIILAVICGLLQLSLSHVIGLGSGHPNFAFVFAVCMALTRGGSVGVVSGFAAGFLFDLTTTGPMGLMSLLLTICSFVLGYKVRNVLAENPRVAYAEAAVAALVVSLMYSLAMLITGDASSIIDVVIFRALPTAILTFLAFLPFGFLLSRQSRMGMGLGGSIGHSLGSLRGGRGL